MGREAELSDSDSERVYCYIKVAGVRSSQVKLLRVMPES